MGNRFGPKILRAGHDLCVYDTRPEAAEALCAAGARWVNGPVEMAEQAEVIITSLPSPTIVEQVVLGAPDALVRVLKPGSAYVDMSTSTPWLARDIAAACDRAGIQALDAPLSNGGVFIGAGGSREAYERCLPLLQAAGDHVFYAGGPGTGQATKLVRQYVSFCNFVTEAEALILADKAGLDAAAIATFLGKTLGTSAHRERVMDAMLRRDFGSPDTAASKLDIVAKDLELAVGLARRVGAPAGTGAAASDVLQRAQAQGWGRINFWSAIRVLEQVAHTQIGRPAGAEDEQRHERREQP